jgi:hypothetical protein
LSSNFSTKICQKLARTLGRSALESSGTTYFTKEDKSKE